MSIMKRDAYLISHKKTRFNASNQSKKQPSAQLLFFCTLACVLEDVWFVGNPVIIIIITRGNLQEGSLNERRLK